MTEVKKSKINGLFTRIIAYGSLSVFFLLLFFTILLFYKTRENLYQQQINILNKENETITTQINDIVSKSITAKNYIKIWNEDFTNEQKKLSGIDIENIKRKIIKLAEDSKMINVSTNFSPLILVDGSFGKQNVNVLTTLLTVKFSTITDIDAFNFIESFEKEIDYFNIIQEFSLKRLKKVDENFLKTLNGGNIVSGVEGTFIVRLYGLENK